MVTHNEGRVGSCCGCLWQESILTSTIDYSKLCSSIPLIYVSFAGLTTYVRTSIYIVELLVAPTLERNYVMQIDGTSVRSAMEAWWEGRGDATKQVDAAPKNKKLSTVLYSSYVLGVLESSI